MSSRIFIFGGPGRSGESTLAKRFAREHQYELVSGGDYMRYIAMADGYVRDNYQIPATQTDWDLDFADTKAHRIHAIEIGRDIDFETDVALIEKMVRVINNSKLPPLVVESKVVARLLYSETLNDLMLVALNALAHPEKELLDVLAAFKRGELDPTEFTDKLPLQRELFKQNSKAVWIDASLQTRATRSLIKLARTKARNLSGTDEIPCNYIPGEAEITAEVENISIRQINDGKAYARVYGFDDFPLPGALPANDKYGTIIDNTQQTAEESYAAVCSALS